MPTQLDYTIMDSMKLSPLRAAEHRMTSGNKRHVLYVDSVKPKLPGRHVKAQQFIPGEEGATEYMGAGEPGPGPSHQGQATLKSRPFDYKTVVGNIVKKYGRVYSWGSATQLPALNAAQWFRGKGHNVFMVWKPELYHVNQSRRKRYGREMDNYGYGYPPEPGSDTWEVLVNIKTTNNPKVRIIQPQAGRTEVMVFESRYPEAALGGEFMGAPSLNGRNGSMGFIDWLLGRKKMDVKQAPGNYTTRAGQGNWPSSVAGGRSRFASERGEVYEAGNGFYGPMTRAISKPDGMERKFATTQLATGQVIPAPRVLPPLRSHVSGPVKVQARSDLYSPKGTLNSMESVFR